MVKEAQKEASSIRILQKVLNLIKPKKQQVKFRIGASTIGSQATSVGITLESPVKLTKMIVLAKTSRILLTVLEFQSTIPETYFKWWEIINTLSSTTERPQHIQVGGTELSFRQMRVTSSKIRISIPPGRGLRLLFNFTGSSA
jgi:hypothetical protein